MIELGLVNTFIKQLISIMTRPVECPGKRCLAQCPQILRSFTFLNKIRAQPLRDFGPIQGRITWLQNRRLLPIARWLP